MTHHRITLNIVSWLTTILLCTTAFGDDVSIRNVEIRSDFQNSKAVFQSTKTGRVAFIGGSITEMNGYRPMVTKYLIEKFPDTKFDFIDAGISSTCSTTGAFRLTRDVLDQKSEMPVNLFFIEFAVNDDQDAAHSDQNCIRGMEGIIRHALLNNPRMDIVLTYFVNPSMLKTIQDGNVPLSIAAHQKVAKHYGVTTILLANEVAHRIEEGTLTWEQYGGTHPGPVGNAIPAEMIRKLLDLAWNDQTLIMKKESLPEPIDPHCYSNGRFLEAKNITLGENWQHHIPDWKSIAGAFRATFAEDKLFCTTTPDDELTIHFSGTALGAYLLAGPDAGELIVSIDDEAPLTVNLRHHYSSGLHYPRTVMFSSDLEDKPHVAKVSLKKSASDKPTVARILEFVVN